MNAAGFARAISTRAAIDPLEDHPVVGALAPASRCLHLPPESRELALVYLAQAIDYGKTAIKDLDRGRKAMARDDIVEVLIQLRALRDILSAHPAAERPIGDEILQEYMR